MKQLKLLNLQRWQAHVDALNMLSDKEPSSTGMVLDASEREAPTAGSLWNVAPPMHKGKFVLPFNRVTDRQEPIRGEKNWISPRDYRRVREPPNPGDWQQTRVAVPEYGRDWSSVRLGSVHKYRIPPTSVTRKQGDCQLFGCCGWRLTAAQWVWWLNFVCFCAHTSMVFITLWMAYWRHGKNAFRDTEHMMIPIYRIRNIPTQFMLDNNMSQWSPGWNLTSSDPNSGLFLWDNGYAINFATLVIAFFATSAIFHFWALVFGAFERYWFWYWRQMDDCFCYWCAYISIKHSHQHTLSLRTLQATTKCISWQDAFPPAWPEVAQFQQNVAGWKLGSLLLIRVPVQELEVVWVPQLAHLIVWHFPFTDNRVTNTLPRVGVKRDVVVQIKLCKGAIVWLDTLYPLGSRVHGVKTHPLP